MTAITATAQVGTSTTPPRVRLSITGAPTPPANAYASSFTTTVDGWTVAGPTGASLLRVGTPPVLRIAGPTGQPAGTVTTASRTVTGLTVGAVYTYRADLTTTDAQVRLGITGGTVGAYFSTLAAGAVLSLTFTAAATSHTITLEAKNTAANVSPLVDVRSVTVQPSGTWQGTKITRTDANGTAVPLRVPVTLDVNGSGALTVYDLEPALTGNVTYTVKDGTGATTSTTTTLPEPAPWLTIPATTDALAGTVTAVKLELITDYRETSASNGTTHTILGRRDKVANPGPLALRSGSVTLWASDYATARTIRTRLEAGDVALLRQPTYPGLDVFLYAQRVDLAPQATITTTRRWSVDIAWDEVAAP